MNRQRGIDVGAKVEIYKLINELARNGVAILMISSELPEVLGMADRIMVIHQGQVAGFLNREEATEERIMEMATGSSMANSVLAAAMAASPISSLSERIDSSDAAPTAQDNAHE